MASIDDKTPIVATFPVQSSTAVTVFDGIRETIQDLLVFVVEKARALWRAVVALAQTHMPRYLKLVNDNLKGKPLTWATIARAAFFAFAKLVMDTNLPDMASCVIMGHLEGITNDVVSNMRDKNELAVQFNAASIMLFIKKLIANLFHAIMQKLRY